MDLGHRLHCWEWLRAWLPPPRTRGLLVTHDLVLASRFADELVLLERGRVAATDARGGAHARAHRQRVRRGGTRARTRTAAWCSRWCAPSAPCAGRIRPKHPIDCAAMSCIEDVRAREILDSRGNRPVEVEVRLDSGARRSRGGASGASTGSREALELRDGGSATAARGVLRASRTCAASLAQGARPELGGLESKPSWTPP
jgi:hypothetical protein